ncbi:MAG: CBS domain-containing protein, partial [Planctomycetota bacterium]
QIVLQVLVLSPVLLVFGEALPKNLMRLEADNWPYKLVWVLKLTRFLCTVTLLLPLIHVCGVLLRRALRMSGEDATLAGRERVAELLREAVPTGAISQEQASLVDRALRFEGATVRDEMVPWKAVDAVRVDRPAATVIAAARASTHTRAVAVDAAGTPVGVLHLTRLLMHPTKPALDLVEQPAHVEPGMPVRVALRRLREAGVPLAIVMDQGRAVGIVTAKDLVEPLTGDLEAW